MINYIKFLWSIIIKKIKRQFKLFKYINKFNIVVEDNVHLDNPNISFGKNVKIYSGVQIWGNGEIDIGDNVAIGKDTIIYCDSHMSIGSNTLISAQCYIIDCDHGTSKSSILKLQNLISKPVLIGEDVWIGAGSIVLKGSVIEKGSVIGANSLVNKKIDEYSINVGSPTRQLKFRKEE